MPPLARLSVRALFAARGPLVGLALLVALATALMGAGDRARRMLSGSRDGWADRLGLADLELRYPLRPPGLAAAVAAQPGVAHAEERALFPGRVSLGDGAAGPGWVHVLGAEGRSRLDAWEILEGRWPRPGEASAVLDRSVQAASGLGVGAAVTVEVAGRRARLPVVGVAVSPEYLVFPVHPEYALPLRGSVSVVGVSADAAAAVGAADLANSLLVLVADGVDPDAVRTSLAPFLPAGAVDAGRRDDQPGRVVTGMIVADFELYVPSTVTVLVVLALLLLAFVLTRLVARDRATTGTLLALGTSPVRAALVFLPAALVPTLVGVALGALAHGPLARSMFAGFAEALGYAPRIDPGPGSGVATAAAACVAAALTAWLGAASAQVRRRPAALLVPAAAPRARRAGLLAMRAAARLVAAARLSPAARLGLLDAVRRGGTTVVGGVALGACLALVTAFLLVHVTSRREVAASVARAGLDVTVHLAPSAGAEALDAVAAASAGVVEPVVVGRLVLEGPRGTASVRATGVAPGRYTAGLRVGEGRMVHGAAAAEVVVDRRAVAAGGFRVGDRLLARPHAHGAGVALELVGVVDGLTFGTAVLPFATASGLFGGARPATGAFVATSRDPATVAASLAAAPGVERVTTCAAVVGEVDRSVAGSTRILVLALLAAAAVAAVFLAVLASFDAADRARDLATLRALGWGEGATFVVAWTAVVVRSGLALALAVPASPWVARWLLSRTVGVSHFPMELQTPWWVLAAPVALLVLLTPLATLPAWRAGRRGLAARTPRLLAAE